MELETRASREQAITGWHCECVVTLRDTKLLSVKPPSNRHVPMQWEHCRPGLWTLVLSRSSQLEMPAQCSVPLHSLTPHPDPTPIPAPICTCASK